jgi:hypothetical protein
MGDDKSWLLLKDAAPLFGMSWDSIKNAVSEGRFPVDTYKLGRNRVIDKDVMAAYFAALKAHGMKKLADNPPQGERKRKRRQMGAA